MSGPVQMYLYVHDAILREFADRMSWFHKITKT